LGEKTGQSPSLLPFILPIPSSPLLPFIQVDHDHIIQQRVAEAVEKTRRQASEERQRLLIEANKQVRDAVAAVRAEMEQKFQQAQSTAIQEALNNQSNSKEVGKWCWRARVKRGCGQISTKHFQVPCFGLHS